MEVKKNLLILFGGRSSEYDISIMSVKNIIRNIDKSSYNLYIVGITKTGRWIYVPDVEDIESGDWIYGNRNAYLLPNAEKNSLMIVREDFDRDISTIHIDVCFPVLHGKNGEDGTIQGLLELANIPYVGCGVLSSSVSMDKCITKLVVENLNIRQAKFVKVLTKELCDIEEVKKRIFAKLEFPVFVKPANAGSSMGVSKAKNEVELEIALEKAAKEDRKILVEEAINGREIECAIFSDGEAKALGVGEIASGNEFYDFEGKYYNEESKTILDPELPVGVKEKVMENAVKIFEALDCFSLSRVDFFLEDETNELVFNEINTMPGFTDISMYKMLAQLSGLSTRELVRMLIESADKRSY